MQSVKLMCINPSWIQILHHLLHYWSVLLQKLQVSSVICHLTNCICRLEMGRNSWVLQTEYDLYDQCSFLWESRIIRWNKHFFICRCWRLTRLEANEFPGHDIEAFCLAQNFQTKLRQSAQEIHHNKKQCRDTLGTTFLPDRNLENPLWRMGNMTPPQKKQWNIHTRASLPCKPPKCDSLAITAPSDS